MAATRPASDAIERLVAALQDSTRRGILLGFYADPHARSVDDVAAAAGVHRTVAFGHLERLVTLGFLGTSQRRGLPGKPAKLYHLVAGPLELHHPARQFATLAGLLGEGLQGFGAEGVAAAREAGRRQGAALCAGAGEAAALSVAEALIPLVLLGGVYEVDGERVVAHNCVFQEACARAPEVICHLHAGMIEGVLEAAGTPCAVTPCDAGGEHTACAYQLTPA
jgi:predicted ArsR family transcriptional regulator